MTGRKGAGVKEWYGIGKRGKNVNFDPVAIKILKVSDRLGYTVHGCRREA